MICIDIYRVKNIQWISFTDSDFKLYQIFNDFELFIVTTLRFFEILYLEINKELLQYLLVKNIYFYILIQFLYSRWS